MKLKELNKKQRASIEADELGKEMIFNFEKMSNPDIILEHHKLELKRTIKRIDDEIEFIQDSKNGDGFHIHKLSERFRKLKENKKLYILMEKLE